jgi:hypothetical protein
MLPASVPSITSNPFIPKACPAKIRLRESMTSLTIPRADLEVKSRLGQTIYGEVRGSILGGAKHWQ